MAVELKAKNWTYGLWNKMEAGNGYWTYATSPVLAKHFYKIECFCAGREMVTLSFKDGLAVEATQKFNADQIQVSSDYKILAINLNDARITSPLSLSLSTICPLLRLKPRYQWVKP
ncbi:hypothetical protein FXO38_19226 [Capsicum annuum]|nr:hypothetical protein FXO38_19226 [Capsicum annuum]KAF3646372.1 hypothetical protein FXO37_20481 [Capsicum annuum]